MAAGRSSSQSLFQGYYLGSTQVDMRCNKALFPWIIEELLLNVANHTSIWFSPGDYAITFVEDGGKEIMTHFYDTVTKFTVIKEKKSFGYLVKSAKGVKLNFFAYCAFESTDVTRVEESVQNIVNRSRSTSPPDSTDLLSESLGSSSGNDLSSSADSFKQSGNFSNSNNSASTTFSLNYLGMISLEVKSLSPAELDKLVMMMKERTVERQRSKSAGSSPSQAKKTAPVSKSPNLRTKRKKAPVDIGPNISVVSTTDEGGPRTSRSHSFNEKKPDRSPVVEKKKKHSLDAGQPPKELTLSEQENSLTSSDSPDGNIVVTPAKDDCDAVEELTGLKSGAELQVLSVDLPKRDVTLTLTKDCVILQDVADDKVIRKRNMNEIACCTQGAIWREYMGFVCREVQSKLFCHMLKADDNKIATEVVAAFRIAFSNAYLPETLCDLCPLNQLNSLFQSLEGSSLEVAQSKVEEALSCLSDVHCTAITTEFNSKKLELTERQQVVLMLSLLRRHFEELQSSHSHNQDGKDTIPRTNSQGRRFLQLEKAKRSLASSFENLKSKGKRNKVKQQKTSNSANSSPVVARRANNVRSPLNGVSDQTTSPLAEATVPLNKPLRITTKPPLPSDQSPINRVSSEIANLVKHKQDKDGPFNTLPRSNKPKSLMSTDTDGFPRLNRIKIRSLRPRSQSPSATMFDSSEQSDGKVRSPPPVVKSPFVKGHRRVPSWRQHIFASVTPNFTEDVKSSIAANIAQSPSFATKGSLTVEDIERSTTIPLARLWWKRAIEHHIVAIQLQKNRSDKIYRMKLAYSDTSIDTRQSVTMWSDIIIKTTQKNTITLTELQQAVRQGIRPAMRPGVWQILVNHFTGRQKKPPVMVNTELTYDELCAANTDYHHAISIDLGRTFPSYPYFSMAVRIGQQALERVLHAYAVRDPEVGYCQGLSFVAGMMLIHTKTEEDAYHLLSHYMNTYQGRHIYHTDMFVLQIRLYQFSRLLHDMNPEIYTHMEEREVTPFMYAAPWLLTLFSSQFPIPFVSRVMDLLFLEGIEAMFKTAIALLTLHQEPLLRCIGMEDTIDYIKNEIPAKAMDNVQDIVEAVLTCDVNVGLKLQHYEVEYRVIHELMSVGPADESLRRQNQDLIEHVAECKGSIAKLESQVSTLQEQITRLEELYKSFQRPPLTNQYTQTTLQDDT